MIGMRVGFIGLGAMGRGMAKNLLKNGHRVAIWGRTAGPIDELARLGATVCTSAKEAFGGDAFISMLSDDNSVREVILDGDVLPQGGSSTIHINMATNSVAFAKELAARHQASGIPYVGAPVFGRDDVAAAGRLNIVAAGDPRVIATIMPVLEAMSIKVWVVGEEPHLANLVKICGNFMIGGAIEAIGEAAALGGMHGISASKLLEVVTSVLFDSPVYRGYGRLIAERKYEPAGFRLALGLKDMRLALAAADGTHVEMPLARLLVRRLQDAVERGEADRDWSAFADSMTLVKRDE